YEPLPGNDIQETTFDMWLEFALCLAHPRLEAATGAQVQLDDLAFDGGGNPPFGKMLGIAPCLPNPGGGSIDVAGDSQFSAFIRNVHSLVTDGFQHSWQGDRRLPARITFVQKARTRPCSTAGSGYGRYGSCLFFPL